MVLLMKQIFSRNRRKHFLITSAQILPYLYEGKMYLEFLLKRNGKGLIRIRIIWNEIKNEFMKDMKVGNVEELEGRFVLGFVHESKKLLDGLGILHKQLGGFSKN